MSSLNKADNSKGHYVLRVWGSWVLSVRWKGTPDIFSTEHSGHLTTLIMTLVFRTCLLHGPGCCGYTSDAHRTLCLRYPRGSKEGGELWGWSSSSPISQRLGSNHIQNSDRMGKLVVVGYFSYRNTISLLLSSTEYLNAHFITSWPTLDTIILHIVSQFDIWTITNDFCLFLVLRVTSFSFLVYSSSRLFPHYLKSILIIVIKVEYFKQLPFLLILLYTVDKHKMLLTYQSTPLSYIILQTGTSWQEAAGGNASGYLP